MRRGKAIIAGRELAARDGGGGARLFRRVDLRRALGAGARIDNTKRGAAREGPRRAEKRAKTKANPFRRDNTTRGKSVLELAKMARDGGGGAQLRRARRFAARARRGRIDETKKVRLEEGRSVRQRALKTREISPSRLRGRR